MLTKNLKELPKARDRSSYLYVEHARIDQEAKAISIHNADGVTPVPCAGLALLMLGPGTRITHAAVLALADNGCMVVWCGEEGVRFYASGQGTTRSAEKLLRQASLCARRSTRLKVVRRMYEMRFGDQLPTSLSLQQIRGKEGARVRDAYARISLETGVSWTGRSYNRGNWGKTDPVNRALSAANSCLYGVCHAAIVAAGYSPGLGFVHTGKQLSFVYDVADLYKTDITIPAAFYAAADSGKGVERSARYRCRDFFRKERLLDRILRDIEYVLEVPPDPGDGPGPDYDGDPALPGGLWDPETGQVEGGKAYEAPAPEIPPENIQEPIPEPPEEEPWLF